MTEDGALPDAVPAGDDTSGPGRPAGAGDPAAGAPFPEAPPAPPSDEAATVWDEGGATLSPSAAPAAAPPFPSPPTPPPSPPPTPPPSPPPTPPPFPSSREAALAGGPRSLLGAVRDNLEAVAFALILALLLRHFCIEVFKIPTASMEPTLFGDHSATHPDSAGDRILVDKLAYLLNDPKRWDVIVFHYPLNWNRNFIKRLAVLPNETFQILSGDLWVAPRTEGGPEAPMRPARKPRNVRNQMYVPVWPAEDEEVEGKRLADWWRADPVATGQFRLVSDGEFRFERGPSARTGEEAVGRLTFGRQIFSDTSARQPRSSGTNHVRDVRWRGTVEAQTPGEIEISWRPGDGRQHALRLTTPGRASSVLRTKESEYPLSARLALGGRTTVEFESVDGDVRATVDGKEERVVADELPFAEALRQADQGLPEEQQLSVSCRGGALVLRDVRVDHDLYYVGPRENTMQVPERDKPGVTGRDQYFMLGDNTTSSSDSRMWNARGQKLKDGSEVWWDSQNSEDTNYRIDTRDGKTTYSVTDVEGVHRAWTEDDVAHDPGGSSMTKRMSFVSRDRIVGRAFFALLFWPLDGATWQRVRFIH